LNVCGIKSKLVSPDFSNLVENYDILVFLESKTDKLDILDIPTDYDYFAKYWTKFKRKSGGIVIVPVVPLTINVLYRWYIGAGVKWWRWTVVKVVMKSGTWSPLK
jgi:hypothetical protein